MTVQEMADIAARYYTAMANAMIAACVAYVAVTGEYLEIPG